MSDREPRAHDPDRQPILRAAHVTKRFADGDVSALLDVSIEIERGQFLAIMGPSGSGKSTLLNLLGALDEPTAGELYFDGRRFADLPSLDWLRSRKIGYVFQAFHLLPTLTAWENVQIPMFGGGDSASRRAARAKALLDEVGMSHRLQHRPNQLSVGERQRVSIARALANHPEVLLADEPTGNLDSRKGEEILELFTRMHRERAMTVVMVTHSREVADCAERLVSIRDGQVVADERLQRSAVLNCQEA